MNQGTGPDTPSDRPSDQENFVAFELISAVAGAVALKERLGLEYDKVLILAAIASRHIAGSATGPSETTGGVRITDSLLAWNGTTMSLARNLGIPRETVRRKLVELHEDGWIMQNGRNGRYGPSLHLLRILAELMPSTRWSA